MIIVGAKGFAKEVLEVFHQLNDKENIAFFDDINLDLPQKLYKQYPILKNDTEVKSFFKTYGSSFCLGVGGPLIRYKLNLKFEALGGILRSTVSPFARIGSFGNVIGDGVNIMTNTVITNDIILGRGSLINLACTIGHDVEIGKFVELCPDVNVSGNCKIGNYTFIGTNTTILPGVEIGSNVIIGAGSVVSKNIPDNSLALGLPAKVIKHLDILNF